MSRTALGEFEHHAMLALVRLGGRSRGAPIVLELETATGRTVSPAAVFVALRRLEQRGYARSSKREARPGEGGRGSREFQITAAGKTKLAESRRTFERLWRGVTPWPSRHERPPPRLATTLLRWLLPDALRDEALDDLREGYLLRLTRDGRRAADRWYRRQVPGFVVRVRLALLTGGPLSAPVVREPT